MAGGGEPSRTGGPAGSPPPARRVQTPPKRKVILLRALSIEEHAELVHAARVSRETAIPEVEAEEMDIARRKAVESVLCPTRQAGRLPAGARRSGDPAANRRARNAEQLGDLSCRDPRLGKLPCRVHLRERSHDRLHAAERIRTSTPVRARRPERRVYTSFTTAAGWVQLSNCGRAQRTGILEAGDPPPRRDNHRRRSA